MRGELEAKQNCKILTPTLMAITAFLFPFSCLAQPGAWGLSLSGTCSSFHHLLSNCNCSIGGPGAQPLCDMFLIQVSSLQLTNFLSSPGLYNCSSHTFLCASQIALNSTRPRSRLYPYIPRPDEPAIYTGAFPILTAWPGSICYRYSFF